MESTGKKWMWTRRSVIQTTNTVLAFFSWDNKLQQQKTWRKIKEDNSRSSKEVKRAKGAWRDLISDKNGTRGYRSKTYKAKRNTRYTRLAIEFERYKLDSWLFFFLLLDISSWNWGDMSRAILLVFSACCPVPLVILDRDYKTLTHNLFFHDGIILYTREDSTTQSK